MNENLWATEFPNIPMPEGCTYWQFAEARDIKWRHEDLDDVHQLIKNFKQLQIDRPEMSHIYQQLIDAEMENLA